MYRTCPRGEHHGDVGRYDLQEDVVGRADDRDLVDVCGKIASTVLLVGWG